MVRFTPRLCQFSPHRPRAFRGGLTRPEGALSFHPSRPPSRARQATATSPRPVAEPVWNVSRRADGIRGMRAQRSSTMSPGAASSRSARCPRPARRSGRARSRPSPARARSRKCGRRPSGTTSAPARRRPRPARAGSERPVASGPRGRSGRTRPAAPRRQARAAGAAAGAASAATPGVIDGPEPKFSVWMRLAATPQPARPAVRLLMNAGGPQR